MNQRDQDKLVAEVKLLGKINAVHRASFKEKFPGSIEHILRLLTERLQLGLDKRNGVDLANPDTWILLPEEIKNLAEAMYYIIEIKRGQDNVSE
jgi:hypothetical protein